MAIPNTLFPVEVLCTVVPEGTKNGLHKMSVVLSPYVAPDVGDTSRLNHSLSQHVALPLETLPKAVSTNSGGKFVLFLHREDGTVDHVHLEHDNAIPKNKLKDVQNLWEKIFDYPEELGQGQSGFQRFHEVLVDPNDEVIKNGSFSAKLPEPELTQSFSVTSLSQRFSTSRVALLGARLMASNMSTSSFKSFLEELGDNVTAGEKNEFLQLINELKSRPFATDFMRPLWLTTLSEIFLPGGTDSALGQLGNLTGANKTPLSNESFLTKSRISINTPIAEFARLIEGQDLSPEILSKAEINFSSALSTRQSNADPLVLSPLSILRSLLKLEPDGLNEEAQTEGARAFANQFRDEVAAYRDAHYYERAPRDITEKMSRRGEPSQKELREGVRRKMSELRAHPTLSKALRLIHDFKVDLKGQNLKTINFVSAAFLDKDTDVKVLTTDPKFLDKIFKTAVTLKNDIGKPRSRGSIIDTILQEISTYAPETASYIKTHKIGHVSSDDGLIDLRVPSRFYLNILDTSQAAQVTESRTQSITEMVETGATQQYSSFEMPHLRSRGIELLDEKSQEETVVDLAIAKSRRTLQIKKPENYLYAEDLHNGIRIDILHTIESTEDTSYHPAMARQVIYPHINEIMNLPSKSLKHPFPEFMARDEGFSSQLNRIRSNNNPAKDQPPIDTAIVSPRLLFWTGEPPGMPSQSVDIKDARLALATDIVFAPPREAVWPILRERDGYRMIARPRLVNGGGPEFLFGDRSQANMKIYEKNALGAGIASSGNVDTPLPFTPPDVINAPEVLLTPSDPLLTPSSKEPVLPDKVTTVVVRSYEKPKPKSRTPVRVIAPPHTSFEHAEQQGQFDSYNGSGQPIGDQKMAIVDWDSDNFTFPFSDITPQIINSKTVLQNDPEKQAKGPIFRGAKTNQDQNYYYIDERIDSLNLTLEDNGCSPYNPLNQKREPVSLRFKSSTSSTLPPIMLSFFPEPDRAYRNWINDGLPKVTVRTSGHRSVEVDHLGIHLLPGAELNLNLTCPLTLNAALSSNYFVQQLTESAAKLKSVVNISGIYGQIPREYLDVIDLLAQAGQNLTGLTTQNKEKLEILWQSTFSELPSDLLNAVEKISVIHAVQKPLDAPSIKYKTVQFKQAEGMPVEEKDIRAFRFVRRTEGPDKWADLLTQAPRPDTDHAYPDAWLYGISSVRMEDNATWTGPAHLEDIEESAIAYIVGEIAIDRNTTNALRCDMLYRDVTAPAAKRRNNAGKWVFDPQIQTQSIFDIKDIKKQESNRPQHLNLAFDEGNNPRNLSLDVGVKARRVAVRLIATSRFESYFEENLPKPSELSSSDVDDLVSTTLGFSEKENAAHADLTKELYQHNCPRIDPNTIIFEEEFWIKSTRRPPGPDIRDTELVFEKREISRSETTIIVEQKSIMRIHLGDHNVCGEGELIALVMLPENLLSDYPLTCPTNGDVIQHHYYMTDDEHTLSSELKDKNMDAVQYDNQLGRTVTAWGTDPTTSSGQLDPIILPSQFSGWSMKKSYLELPLGDDHAVKEKPYPKVAVMGFEPILHAKHGTWYIDIDTDATRADSPFFRLSLARCQMQCLPGLELSVPTVLEPIQVPPKRWVEVNMMPDGVLEATVTGAGYTRRDPAINKEDDAEEFMQLKSLADVPFQNFQLMRRSAQNSYVQLYDSSGTALEHLRVLPVQQDTGLKWVVQFTLPNDINPSDIRLSIFETELNSPDANENVPSDPLIETIRPFACDIDLIHDSGSGKPNIPKGK